MEMIGLGERGIWDDPFYTNKFAVSFSLNSGLGDLAPQTFIDYTR